MTYSNIKKFSDRSLPAVMRMVPTDKPGETTEARLEKIRFDIELKDELFSLRNLQR